MAAIGYIGTIQLLWLSSPTLEFFEFRISHQNLTVYLLDTGVKQGSPSLQNTKRSTLRGFNATSLLKIGTSPLNIIHVAGKATRNCLSLIFLTQTIVVDNEITQIPTASNLIQGYFGEVLQNRQHHIVVLGNRH